MGNCTSSKFAMVEPPPRAVHIDFATACEKINNARTLYEVLFIHPESTREQIDNAYKSMKVALRFGRNFDSGTEEHISKVTEMTLKLIGAYQVLSNEGERRKYNTIIENAVEGTNLLNALTVDPDRQTTILLLQESASSELDALAVKYIKSQVKKDIMSQVKKDIDEVKKDFNEAKTRLNDISKHYLEMLQIEQQCRTQAVALAFGAAVQYISTAGGDDFDDYWKNTCYRIGRATRNHDINDLGRLDRAVSSLRNLTYGLMHEPSLHSLKCLELRDVLYLECDRVRAWREGERHAHPWYEEQSRFLFDRHIQAVGVLDEWKAAHLRMTRRNQSTDPGRKLQEKDMIQCIRDTPVVVERRGLQAQLTWATLCGCEPGIDYLCSAHKGYNASDFRPIEFQRADEAYPSEAQNTEATTKSTVASKPTRELLSGRLRVSKPKNNYYL